MDDAYAVDQDDVCRAEVQQQLGRRDAAGPGSGEHEGCVLDLAIRHSQSVDDRSEHGNGGAVLVVVEHGDAQILQGVLDVEALGRCDILEIDTAQAGSDGPHRPDNLGGVLRGDADRIGVHSSQVLE